MSNWRRPSERHQTKEERNSLWFFTVFGFVMACCGFLGIYFIFTGAATWSRRAPVAAVALALAGVVMFGASLSELIKTRRRH